MTYFIYKQQSITPANFAINVRNNLDDSGPHLMTFGCRTVVAGGSGATVTVQVRYENTNGEIQTLFLPANIVLAATDQAGGGIWYHDMVEVIDIYHPLGDGPYVENPYGVFSIDFAVSGTVGASKISYEAIVQRFDGVATVVTIP